MLLNVEKLKAEALRLSSDARVYLARELLASLDAMSESEIEKLWIDETIRRDKDLDSGKARAYPADEVLARARDRRK
jgi:putative addiction module component (TIGR02574 family)